jgi:hypothetical protein
LKTLQERGAFSDYGGAGVQLAKLKDIVLRKAETDPMIVGDRELNRQSVRVERQEREICRNRSSRAQIVDIQPEIEDGFFCFSRCNPLKRPISTKELQTKPSFFACIFLDLFGFFLVMNRAVVASEPVWASWPLAD